MNNIVQNLEEQILKYNGIKIDYFPANDSHEGYWRYECNKHVKLSPDVSVGSFLCYSVSGKTREEACNKLYNAIKRDQEAEENMIKAYEKMQQGIDQ